MQSNMQHLIMSPGDQRCLLYSFAMVTDCEIPLVEYILGHTGKEPVFKNSIPAARSTHIQEVAFAALKLGYATVFFEPVLIGVHPHSGEEVILKPELEVRKEVNDLLSKYRAILLGRDHAVAWDCKRICDPNPSGKFTMNDWDCGLLFVPIKVT